MPIAEDILANYLQTQKRYNRAVYFELMKRLF